MNIRSRLAAAALAIGSLFATGNANAFFPFFPVDPAPIRYDITLTNPGPAISPLVSVTQGWFFGNYSAAQLLGGVPANSLSHTAVDPGPVVMAFAGLLLGVSQDAALTKHVVIGMNNTAAAAAVGEAWDTLFPTLSEATLIGHLEGFAADPLGYGTAYSGVQEFGSLAPTMAFDIDPFGSATTSFTLVQFSTGTVVGTGSAAIVAVPEPSSVLLMAGGLGLFAVALRRRRRAG